MKQAIAKLKNLKIAPRKVRLLADVLKGMPAVVALAQLHVTNLRSAGPLAKLIRSAVANAKVLRLDVNKLVIKSITVNQGIMMKRYLPRARGSASELQKKFCHVAVILEESQNPKLPSYTLYEKQKAVKNEKVAVKPKLKDSVSKEGTKEEPKVKSTKKGFFKQVFNRKAMGGE